jgi:hypothetical protein
MAVKAASSPSSHAARNFPRLFGRRGGAAKSDHGAPYSLSPRPATFGDINERDDAISLTSILILDDAGIGFHERDFRLLPLEGPYEIVTLRKSIIQREVRLVFQPE